MSYVYENPTTKGFIKIPVSVRTHNQLFPMRKRKFGAKVEYYYLPEGGRLTVQYFTSNWAKIAIISLMFIPAIFMQGIPETIRDTADLIYERKRGKFCEDGFWLNHGGKPHKELADYLARYADVGTNQNGEQ